MNIVNENLRRLRSLQFDAIVVGVDVVVHVDVAVHDVAGRQHRRRCRRIDSVFGTKLFGLFLALFRLWPKAKNAASSSSSSPCVGLR